MSIARQNKDQVSVIEVLEKEIADLVTYEKSLNKKLKSIEITYKMKEENRVNDRADFLKNANALDGEWQIVKAELDKVQERLKAYEERCEKLRKKYGKDTANKNLILKDNVADKAESHKFKIDAINAEIEKATEEYKKAEVEYSTAFYRLKNAPQSEAFFKRNATARKLNELIELRDRYQAEYNKMVMGDVKKDKEIAAMMV